MRGNWGALAVVLCAVTGIVGVAFGAHIYRWEVLTWQSVAALMALLVWLNSRQERTKEGE